MSRVVCLALVGAVSSFVVIGNELSENALVLLQMQVSVKTSPSAADRADISIDESMASSDLDAFEYDENLLASDASSKKGIILRHMSTHNASICACAKCGSTSLWAWIFLSEMGHYFRDDTDKIPLDSPQDVDRSAWHGKFKILRDREEQEKALKEGFSFALVRDPKERLISAWKNKVACGERDDYGTDVNARQKLVDGLVTLWGRKAIPGEDCMSLERFASVLLDIHMENRDHMLNAHFLPQNKGCFARHSPSRWTIVADVTSEDPFAGLAKQLKFDGRPEHKHQSTKAVLISDEAADLLDKITAAEYKLLRGHLSHTSLVKAGSSV